MFLEITDFIKEVGFPVFVSCFLLIKINPTLHKLELTMKEMYTFLKKQNGKD